MTVLGITLGAAAMWFIVAGILAIVEAFTMGLITIWFAGGAVGAAVVAMVGAPMLVQVIAFLVISLILVIVTRPLEKNKLNNKTEKTNIDAIIGMEGIVEQNISSHKSGQVRADGKVWTAICQEGEIKKGALVVIKTIKGVTLIVEEKKQEGN